MKTIILILSICWFPVTLMANPAYEKAMKKQLSNLEAAESQSQWVEVANAFERIAQKESDQWLPFYYAALSYANLGLRGEDLNQKDQYYDKASELVDKAAALKPSESEITALQGYIVMGRIAADSQSRGPSLSSQALQLFNQAIAQDPDNPRALLLLAQMEYGMAQFFGNTPEKACKMARKSLDLFEKQAGQSELEPRWGKEMAQGFLSQCP
ncbi:MAG: hypothetical protein ACNS62_23945 [Candidatus Cyclobacteriaceae bacterium M3_2C_046]